MPSEAAHERTPGILPSARHSRHIAYEINAFSKSVRVAVIVTARHTRHSKPGAPAARERAPVTGVTDSDSHAAKPANSQIKF